MNVIKTAINGYHPEADGGFSILDDSLGINRRIPPEHAILTVRLIFK